MSVHNGKPPKLQSYGKQLDTLKISGWADNYICYASLKSALGEVACTLKTSEEAAEASPSASSHFDRNKLQAMTASFFAKLEDELEKVSDFHHELTLSAKRTYRETKAYVSPILARIHSGAPVTKEDHDKLEKMMGSMMEAHQQLTRIQHFGHINEKGFYKIMTKYNHMFQQTDDALIFLENLGSADFVHTRHHIKHIKSDILGLARNIEDAWRRHAGSRGVDSPDERGSDDEGEADRSLIGSVLSPRTSELNDSFADLLNNHRRGVTGSLNSANGVYNDDGDEEHVEFQIQPREEPWETLARYESFLSERSRSHLGYPYNLSFRSDELRNFLRYSINNLGDPFVASNYGVHSRVFEVAVLKFFADLWKIGQDEFWGYVTTCGTEGNLHAILVAREVLPDAILYSSTESHYSVFKAARFYRMDAQPISTTYSGQLNLLELEKSLLENKDRPAIINCNVGTTVKGAVDDVDGVIATLHKCGYTKDRYYIHCDGALFALMLPFCGREAPQIDFTKPIDSMSVSGHKFLGCPMPCGAIITRKEHIKKVERNVEYLNSKDTTIMGSRNGQAPLLMWYTLRTRGTQGLAKDVEQCLSNATFLQTMLNKNNIGNMLCPYSSTVVLEKPPSETFILKWQLACQGNIAHVVVMPNVTRDILLMFVQALVECRKRAGSDASRCVKNDIGPKNCRCAECSDTE